MSSSMAAEVVVVAAADGEEREIERERGCSVAN